MRVLFNHGLSIEELYTNTPKSIIDRKWRWFIKHYGVTSTYEDAISDPFKYCIGLIIHKMLDDKVRFIIPVRMQAYLDFEVVTEERFVRHRQYGRFQDIDFVNSDFTGYAIRYYFKSKAYQKSYQLYLGGDLKKKFLDGINSGVKYYTIKDVTINDFIDDVHEKFSELTRKEVRNLLLHGFRRMHSAMRFGCGITIGTNKFTNCYFHIGAMYLDPKKQMQTYCSKRDKKLRKIEGWKKLPFDGYYYIGLTPSVLERWVKVNASNRVILRFEKVMVKKIMEELYYRNSEVYIFRFKLKKFKGYLFWAENLKARDVTYMGKVENLKFIPSNMTWKELIKTYEATNN